MITDYTSILDKYSIDRSSIPKHIAIIMDGNGRWAKEKGEARYVGHQKGYQTLTETIEHCDALGISYLSVYAFSTENWKRPKTEVSFLMTLLKKVLKNEIHKLINNKVKLRFYGDMSELSQDVSNLIKESEEKTANFTGLQVNIMFNYGSRNELCSAVKTISSRGLKDAEITEELITETLYTHDLPDPEILIRPGGEYRLSNFMLWQCAYSELFFTETLWPDFSLHELVSIIKSFQDRHRRFGGL